VHSVLGKEGLLPSLNYLWGPGGARWLDETNMGDAYETRVRSLRRLIKTYDTEITKLPNTNSTSTRRPLGIERASPCCVDPLLLDYSFPFICRREVGAG
jgi:hypothetical protein